MDQFLLAGAVAYGSTLFGGLILRPPERFSRYWAIPILAILLGCPLFISPQQTITRGLVAFLCGDLIFKVVDCLRHLRESRSDAVSWSEYLRFLMPFPVLLAVRELRQRRLQERSSIAAEVGIALLAACGFLAGSGLLYAANQTRLVQESFFVEHFSKLAIVVILVESASQFVFRLERLARYDTTPPMQNILASKTVGEFWSRWNTRIHQWLLYNVFLTTGGPRRPVRGIVYCFIASALLHEVTLGIATSRFDGYQFSFFMLQIPPVLLSRRMQRFARRRGVMAKALCHVSTIAWISVTSILFFPAIDRVFPFYYVSDTWLP